MVALVLTGPVLHHEKIIRELGRLFVFVDGSASMRLSDPDMPIDRKVAALQSIGTLPGSTAFSEASSANTHLARAQFNLGQALRGTPDSIDLKETTKNHAADLEAAFKAFEKFTGSMENFERPDRGYISLARYNGNNRMPIFDGNNRRDPNKRRSLPAPDSESLLSRFEFPTTHETEFGLWARGYIHPPKSGDYRFWVSSDDQSGLFLSDGDSYRNISQLCKVDGWTPARNFESESGQQSRSIRLESGKRYYIELILNAGTGENHFSVAWQPPGGQREIINGQFLSPFADEQDGDSKTTRQRMEFFRKNLLVKAEELRDRIASGKIGDPFAVVDQLKTLRDTGFVLQERLRQYILAAATRYHAEHRDDPEFQRKLAAFDDTTRLDRLRELMLDPDTGLLRELAGQQDIEFVSLRGTESDTLWWQRRGGKKSSGPIPLGFGIDEGAGSTNLSSTMRDALGREEEGGRRHRLLRRTAQTMGPPPSPKPKSSANAASPSSRWDSAHCGHPKTWPSPKSSPPRPCIPRTACAAKSSSTIPSPPAAPIPYASPTATRSSGNGPSNPPTPNCGRSNTISPSRIS